MILVDTCVWIEYLKRRQPIHGEMTRLLTTYEVLAHEVVFAELIQGFRKEEEVDLLLQFWHNMPSSTSDGGFLEAGRLAFDERYARKGVGLIDATLIAEARHRGIKIWTLDKRLQSVLREEEMFRIT